MFSWFAAGAAAETAPLRATELYRRARVGGWWLLGSLLVLALGELVARPGENPTVTALQVLTAVGVGAAVAAVGRARTAADVVGAAMLTEMWCALGSAAIAVATGHTSTSLIVLVALTAGGAAFLPWGWRPQAVIAVWNSAMFPLEIVIGGHGTLHESSRELVALAVINVGSVFVAREFERQRRLTRLEQERRLAREGELEENAAVAAALARVGEGVIFALNRVDLLERLCALTCEEVAGDSAHVWLLDAEQALYRPACQFPEAAGRWEAVRLLRAAAESVEVHRVPAEREGALWIPTDELAMPYRLLAGGLHGLLWIALRRGDETAGALLIGYRQAPPPGARQLRIARGIAQLASLGLANARLHDELQRANSLKSEFMATMSHELRTPLNVIIGYCALLLEGAMGDLGDEQSATLQRVHENAVQLLELINATLDVSRLETGSIPLDLAAVDLAAVIGEVEARTRDLRAHNDVAFEWRIDDGVGPLVTDAAKLRIILTNLIGNAFKFTADGRVEVRVVGGPDAVEIAVSDTGIGIPPEVQQVIFEPFRQADATIGARYGGVGLGLFIVHRLVEALSGEVGVESAVGHGSTFRIRLPKLAADTSRVAVR